LKQFLQFHYIQIVFFYPTEYCVCMYIIIILINLRMIIYFYTMNVNIVMHLFYLLYQEVMSLSTALSRHGPSWLPASLTLSPSTGFTLVINSWQKLSLRCHGVLRERAYVEQRHSSCQNS
jgi:hypothetical protein